MKKMVLIAFFMMAMVIGLTLVSAIGDEKEAEIIETFSLDGLDFKYLSHEDLTVQITGGMVTDETFVIPSTVTYDNKEWTVSSIGASAFKDNKSIKKLIIPDTMDALGKGAFKNCKNLTCLTVPISLNTVVKNNDPAFKGCKLIDTITFTPGNGEGHNYGDNTYTPWRMNEKALQSIYIPEGVKTIGDNTFRKCSHLTDVVVSDTVEEIHSNAFRDCKKLVELKITDSITSIGKEAFRNCKSLKTFSIPKGVTKVEKSVFEDCSSLENVDFGNITKIADYAFKKTSMKDVTLPDTLVNVGAHSFEYCKIKNLVIPDSVTALDVCTFKDCKGLRELTLPVSLDTYSNIDEVSNSLINVKGIERIHFTKGTGYGFDYKKSGWNLPVWRKHPDKLVYVSFEDGVLRIGNNTLKGCHALDSVYFSNTLEEIGKNAFSECDNLYSTTLPNSVKFIDEDAFQGACRGSITMPVSVKLDAKFSHASFYSFADTLVFTAGTGIGADYGDDLPWRNDAVKTVIFKEGVKVIGKNMFKLMYLRKVIFMEEVEEIREGAFKNCRYLESIELPHGVKKIGKSAFEGVQLNEFNFEKTEEIGDFAFKKSKLQNINLPDITKSIGKSAFKGCGNLKNLSIPISLDPVVDKDNPAFSGCKNINSITFTMGTGNSYNYDSNANTPWHISKNKLKDIVLLNGAMNIGTNMFRDCEKLENVTLPDTLTEIPDGAFSNCKKISKISLPSKVTALGEKSFENCSGMKEINLENVKHLGNFALKNTGIVKIELAKGISNIGRGTFENCKSLVELDLPNTIMVISDKAFKGCNNLQSISFGEHIVSIGKDAFKGFKFYESDGTTILSITPEDLNGFKFAGNKKQMIKQGTSRPLQEST